MAKIGQDIQYCANIGKQYCANVGISILANISIPILRQYCFNNIGMPILAQYWHANIGQYCYANIGAILFANIGPILFRYYYSNIGQYCQFTYWYACVTSDIHNVLWFCALMSTVLLIKHLQIESREEVVVTYFETDCITRRSGKSKEILLVENLRIVSREEVVVINLKQIASREEVDKYCYNISIKIEIVSLLLYENILSWLHL